MTAEAVNKLNGGPDSSPTRALLKPLVLFFTCLCFWMAMSASAADGRSHYRFKTLSNPQIDLVGGQWDTVEDSLGFIWFGGAGGVARYDGYDLKLYRNNPEDPSSLSNNYVTDLLIDSRGQLWVSTFWGLNRYDPLTDSFESYEHDDSNPQSLSHNYLWGLIEDSKGFIWLATDGGGLSRLDPQSGTFKNYLHDPADPTSIATNFTQKIIEDREGIIWVATKDKGLDRLDPSTEVFTHFPYSADNPNGISDPQALGLHEDKRGNLWVGTQNGLNLMNRETGSFTHYLHDVDDPDSIGGNTVRSIMEDSQGNLWMASDGGGINLFNRDTGQFDRYMKKLGATRGLANNKVRSIFEDSNGGIWFGHYPAGITVLDRYASAFTNYSNDPFDKNSLSNSDVLSVDEDEKGNLWIGTEKGLNYLERDSGRITRYEHDPTDPDSLQADPVLSVRKDSRGYIWVGTWGGGLSRLDESTGRFIKYPSLNAIQSRAIFEDSQSTLWVGTENGISRYVPETDNFVHYRHDPKDDSTILSLGVNTIYEDSRGVLWAGVDSGLVAMDRRSERFERFVHDAEDPGSIGPGYVSHINEDNKGNIWVATGANGVNKFNPRDRTFSLLTAADGLADDRVGAILPDVKGNIWFGTGRGLSRYNPESKEFHTYTDEHGLPGNLYKRPGCIITSDGELVFGSTKGLSIFDPKSIANNFHLPKVAITDFLIFNKSVDFSEKDAVINKPITRTQALTLDYFHSVFSFEFAALNYVMPEKNEYAYMLEGFDRDWVYIGSRRTTTYTNLDAGSYTFRVKASNNEGLWNEEGTALSIQILPPPWRTWWAYTLYVLAVAAMVARYVYGQHRKRRLIEEQNRILEVKVAERTAELRKKNKDIQAMLSNMRQGLFTVTEGCVVHPEYSRFLESIFDTQDIAGRNAIDLMFSSAKLGSDEVDQVTMGIESIIEEDEINYDFNSHVLLREYSMELNNETRYLTLDWNPIVEDEVVKKLMVSVRDVTQLRQMESAAASQKRELEIIGQIIKVPSKKFVALENSAKEFIRENRENIQATKARDNEVIALLFRNMHTIKGNCRTFGMKYLSDTVHEVESTYSDLKASSDKPWSQDELLADLQRVEEGLAEYSYVFHEVLGRGESADDGLVLDDAALEKIRDCLESFDSEEDRKKLQPVQSLLDGALSAPLPEVLNDIVSSLPSIASQLGKAEPKVEYDTDNVRINNVAHDLVNNVFAHILRNCIDHGIEPPDDRVAAGKPEQGTISIHTTVHDNMLSICVKDDGRGVNIDRLLQKGIEVGQFNAGDTPSAEEVAQLIFMSGVSTKEEVSDISGRGVGMDAVKQFLMNRGGNISLKLLAEKQEGQAFVAFESVVDLPAGLFSELSA